MNAKRAKLLRSVTGYKNPSKTPSRVEFPGVGKLLQFPRVARNENGHVRATKHFVFNGRWWQHDVTPEMALDKDGKMSMAFDLVPTTKPGRHKPDAPRGTYRALKRLDKRVGLDNVAAGALHNMGVKHAE